MYKSNGCIPSKKDSRDYQFDKHKYILDTDELLNKSIDLRNDFMPEVFSQGGRGSCVAEASVASYWYQVNKLYGEISFYNSKEYSRRFLYFMSRYLDGKVKEDCGTSISSACKALRKFGVCSVLDDDDDEDIDKTPDFYAITDAADDRIEVYYTIDKTDLIQYLTCLDNNIPVIISTNIDEFSDARYDGLSSECLSWDKPIGSGHAMLIVGRIIDFDYFGKKRNVFVIRNSWGKKWGDKGYCYIPEDIMIKYGVNEAKVIIKDDFQDYGETSNYTIKKFGRLKAIPNNSIIFENIGYSKDYLNKLYNENNKKYFEIFNKISSDIDKLVIKDKSGKWKNVYKEDITPEIKFPISYVNQFGTEFVIK